MPLYVASDKWEYMVVPDQHGKRFGNNYYFNHYGMRCDEVDSTKAHILGLGDSVIYGGVQTDQDSIASSIFTRETGMQMLNISAGSWGPDNCAAYLKTYGMFDARAVFLVVSSHDAHDNMDFKPVVGSHVSYPTRQYPCAIAEVVCRYALPRLAGMFKRKSKELDPDQKVLAGIHKSGINFNSGFDQLKAMCDSVQIPMFVILHAEISEIEARKYNSQGEEITRWCEQSHVQLVKDMNCGMTAADYRDNIHLNERGQRKMASIMERTLKAN